MNERVAVLWVSVALAAVVTGTVLYALRALAALADVATQLGNLPPP